MIINDFFIRVFLWGSLFRLCWWVWGLFGWVAIMGDCFFGFLVSFGSRIGGWWWLREWVMRWVFCGVFWCFSRRWRFIFYWFYPVGWYLYFYSFFLVTFCCFIFCFYLLFFLLIFQCSRAGFSREGVCWSHSWNPRLAWILRRLVRCRGHLFSMTCS